MSTPSAPPVPCPDCGVPLTGASTCTSCGLPLTGPAAAQLWAVDQQLFALEAQREQLARRRTGLLADLRGGTSFAVAPPAASAPPYATRGDVWATPAAGVSSAPAPRPAAPAAEWTPQRVQNSLLGLGALLLAVACVVFAAVTYDRLGAGGRAAVLLTLTALAGAAVPRLRARGLLATGEWISAVTLALAALDAYALRKVGLAGSIDATVYTAWSALVLAGLSAAYAVAVPARVPRFAAVVLSQLTLPLLMLDARTGPGDTSLGLSLQVAADLGLLVGASAIRDAQLRRDVQLTLTGCAVVVAALTTLTGCLGVFDYHELPASLALLVLAVTSAAAAGVATDRGARTGLAGAPSPLVAIAAVGLARDELTAVQLPLVVAAVGLLTVQLAALLPRDWRDGPATGAVLVSAGALATQAESIARALVLPFGWLGSPWSVAPGIGAREAISPDGWWGGTVVTLVVLAVAAVTVVGAGVAVHRVRESLIPACVLVVLTVLVLPLGLATSYRVALAILVASSAAFLSGGALVRRADLSAVLSAVGTVTAVLAAVWSVADEHSNLVVLAVVTALFAAAALRRPEMTAAAGLTAAAALAAAGASRGVHVDQVGGLLLLVPTVLVALTFLLDGVRRIALEVAAVVVAAAAMTLAVDDAGWLSWTLAVSGLLALAEALHPDRRWVAVAGALLLSASSWVRLADAHVEAPEPYVVPLGLMALGLGWLRVREAPGTRSMPAYGPGISLLLVPSLLASFDDESPTRPLLLAGVAILVLLVGARLRMQAPILIGGGVLAIDALQLLAPYAAALPRWLSLGAAGLLLVGVGATYEQRRRDVERIREQLGSLT